MEFRFDIKPIFREPITRITSNMLPHNFRGDRRASIDHATKVAEIINTVGEYSAKAQGLSKPVTTAQKLRQSDHTIYLLVDTQDGKNGSVIGMLKIGKKNLYVFDPAGETKMVDNAKCILDFYIHESRQRAGLGKDLFDTMLKHEMWEPREIAVDRPSDKLLGFLKKHYGLDHTVPQMNNFVIYDGFFNDSSAPNGNINNNYHHPQQQMHITNSPNSALFGPIISTASASSDNNKYNRGARSSINNVPHLNNPIGRYAAGRPTCSMAEKVIHESKSKLQATSTLNLAAQKTELPTTTPRPASRLTYRRQLAEKRCGLQDVYDESYMTSNQFNQMPAAGKRSGLDVRESHAAVRLADNINSTPNEASLSQHNINPSEPTVQKSKVDMNQNQADPTDHAKNCEAEIIHQSAMQKADEPNSLGHEMHHKSDNKSDTESLIDHINIALSINKNEIDPDDMIEPDVHSEDDIHVEIDIFEDEEKHGDKHDYAVERPGAGKATVYNESVWETNYPDSDNEVKPTKYRSAKKHAGNKNISSGVSGSFQDTPPNDNQYETSSNHDDDAVSVTVSIGDRTTGKISYDLHQHNKLW